MRIESTREELLKAYALVVQDIGDVAQLISHLYSGDKDTLRESAETVLRKNGVPTKLTHEEFLNYTEQYKDEIEHQFHEYVEYGKVECPKADNAYFYIKERYEFLNDASIKPQILESFDIEPDLTDFPF